MEKGEIEMLIHMLGEIEVFFFAWGILQMEFMRKRRSYVCALLFFIGAELFYQLCPNGNIGFLAGRLIGPMLGTVILFEGVLGKRLAQYWFSLFYTTAFYLPLRVIDNILKLNGKSIPPFMRDDTVISVLVSLIILMIAVQIKKRDEWVDWVRSIPIGYYVLAIICAFAVEGIVEFTRTISVFENAKTQIFIQILQVVVCLFLYSLGVAVAFTNLWRKQHKRESALKDEYLRMSKAHYDELANHLREVRSIRHDLRAHMNVLESYIEEERWEQAKEYLKEIKEHQSGSGDVKINIGNELVNAVLIDGMRSCGKDITLVCEGMLPRELNLSDYDLCTIFSNLLSNAVEACKKLRQKEKRIVLQIKRFQNNVVIMMENPIEWEVPIERLGEFTSKTERKSHGYGIYNIKKAVKSYDGEVEFHVKDELFQVRILLYQAIKEK